MLSPLLRQGAADVTVNASQITPISKYIYGVNFPDWNTMNLPWPLARQGGNRMTAYNWVNNASNAGNDYFNQNDGYLGTSNVPGWTVSQFLKPCQAHGAAALLTVPILGYVAADKDGGGDVDKTPNYLQTRFDKSYAVKPGGHFIYPPNLNHHAVYQDEFVHWVESIKASNTPVWFALDNEPDIWSSTHSRIHPQKLTYAEIIHKDSEYATAIKAQAPNTLIFGPVNYGWAGFMGLQGAPDADGRNFLNVYLAAMRQKQAETGKRLLDVLDIHWYPEARGGGQRITDADKPGTASARIQAPRSLWDLTYVENSWISDSIGHKPIQLLPMIMGKISKYYPGTKFAITEYNYGGNKEISGAIAQADVLGIFGRYGVFAACNWGITAADTGEMAGFRAFLNYDGKGDQVGNRMLGVTGGDPAKMSVYAMLDTHHHGRLTLVLINKTKHTLPFRVALPVPTGSVAQAWRIDSESLQKSVPQSVDMGSGKLFVDAPALSIITVEIDHQIASSN